VKTKTVQVGLGKIGREMAKLVASRQNFELVGLMDLDENMVGRKASEVLGTDPGLDLRVTDNEEDILSIEPDLVFHSTKSSIPKVAPQLKKFIEAGADVISTTEELSYPFLRHEEASKNLNQMAEENGVTLFGTGVNPGFAMDLLPLTFSGIAQQLEKVSVKRIQNASQRRRSLQEKIGVGLTKSEFNEEVKEKGGHVGLIESLALVGTGLGWKLEEVETETEPVIAEENTSTDFFDAAPGEVIGMRQIARGFLAGKEKVELDLKMYAGATEPVDRISLSGVPEVTLKVPGGIHGDIATPAIAVNSAAKVIQSEPGLMTVLDLNPYPYSFENPSD
jgi:hypothetical protein